MSGKVFTRVAKPASATPTRQSEPVQQRSPWLPEPSTPRAPQPQYTPSPHGGAAFDFTHIPLYPPPPVRAKPAAEGLEETSHERRDNTDASVSFAPPADAHLTPQDTTTPHAHRGCNPAGHTLLQRQGETEQEVDEDEAMDEVPLQTQPLAAAPPPEPRPDPFWMLNLPLFPPNRHGIQAKLHVGEVNDTFEQEADRVADTVMRMPGPGMQRRGETTEEEEDESLQAKSIAESITPWVQRQAQPEEEDAAVQAKRKTPTVSAELEAQLNHAQGRGQPLSDSSRAFFEPRFRQDFSQVRIHADNPAAEAADTLHAQAFTHKKDIYFGVGRYQPETEQGKTLLAHELTHTIQQTGHVQRQAEDAGAAPTPGSITASVDIIMQALEGPTTLFDSARILAQFQGKDPAETRAILSAFKRRAGPGAINWLLSDLTAEDRQTLRGWLIERGVVADLGPIVAGEILERLEGYTDEEDSQQILARLRLFTSAALDGLLIQLETRADTPRDAFIAWLFGDLDRVSADRLREHFFKNGGALAVHYASAWTAERIASLLAGFTSGADSGAIVRHFEAAGTKSAIVQTRLNLLTQTARGQPAGAALMEDMRAEDYRTLQALPGLALDPYVQLKSDLESAIEVAEWALIVPEWIVCGAVGVVTGALGVVKDLFVAILDLIGGVWNLLWSLAYFLSAGLVGSENWLAVKRFFIGIAEAVANPGGVWDAYWENLKREFATIEGPLTDCRRAEFIVRKFINGLVNIALIVVGGVGLVKGGIKLVRRAVQRIRTRRVRARVEEPEVRPPDAKLPSPPVTRRKPGEGIPVEAAWGNPKSVKAYGHSVSEHGAKRPPVQLSDRARGTGEPQGQWYDDQFIVEAEQIAPLSAGEHIIEFGKPVGRVYFLSEGARVEILENVSRAIVVRRADLTVRTSYPFTGKIK